jgi:glycosyltransferase involved in cell wall biosynthesis
MKPPDHPIASGDREIGRLILAALVRAGCSVEIASRFISYQKQPSFGLFEAKKREGEQAAQDVIAAMSARPPGQRPQLWLTYHPYCKAPDWLGPVVTSALEIPYATVEACRTRQNTDADWLAGRQAAQAAIRHAAINFCLKPSDLDYLRDLLGDERSIVRLAPFIDVDAATTGVAGRHMRTFAHDDPVILAVGMMRPNKKAESYRILAQALRQTGPSHWNLVVIGDGPERDRIADEFAFVDPQRIHFTGAIAREEVLAWMGTADVFAWPGYRESIGLVFLEAQANSLPVVALRSLGVPMVVVSGKTGFLVDEGDPIAYAKALQDLLASPATRRKFGEAGRRHVRRNHGLEAASATFRRAFDRCVEAA